MRIACPFCGERDGDEFQIMGETAGPRPHAAGTEDEFFEYVYLRDNVAGAHDEYWYHGAGCRRWLIVTRDTRTHALIAAKLAAP